MNIVQKLSFNSTTYLERYYQILEDLISNINEIERNESISQLFSSESLIVRDAGIKLSENILSFTTNPNVEQTAKNIIEEFSNYIQNIKTVLQNINFVNNENNSIDLYDREFNQIFNSLIQNMKNCKNTNNLNLNFLSAMIPFFEGLISLAKNVLRFDINDEIKEIAINAISQDTNKLLEIKNLIRII